jgi:hypothetical protein
MPDKQKLKVRKAVLSAGPLTLHREVNLDYSPLRSAGNSLCHTNYWAFSPVIKTIIGHIV